MNSSTIFHIIAFDYKLILR